MSEALLAYFNISFATGALVSILSGVYVLFYSKHSATNQSWASVTLFGSFWGLSYFLMINSPSEQLAVALNRIIHILAIGTLVSYLLFCTFLTNQYDRLKDVVYSTSFLGLLLAAAVNFDFLLEGVRPGQVFNYVPVGGSGFIFFSVYLICVAIIGLLILYNFKERSSNQLLKKQAKYVFVFSSLGWIGGASVLPLTHGISILPYPIIIWALYPFFATYAIVKLNLFNTKTVTAQILSAFLWVFLAVRLILSNSTTDFIINSVVLGLTIPAGILLIRGISQEIRERERAEKLTKELKHLNEQKSKMLSIASHQFRSPLTSIEGYASLVKNGSYGEVPQKLNEPVTRILKSSKRLATIVDDFLNISRIEDGRMEYNFQITNLKDIVEEVVEEAEGTIKKENIDLRFVTDESDDYLAKVDVGKLQQVITNLIDNANKYTAEGFIEVRLEKEKGNILMEVEDSGIGIEPKDKEEIFKQFSRADKAQEVNVVGSGLGLYIARQIVKAHDGRIWVTSDGRGEGSTFHVQLNQVNSDT